MHLSGATAFLCDSAARTSPSFILCKVQQRLLHSASFQLQTAADDICDLTVVLNACIAQMVLSQADLLICSIDCRNPRSACQIRSKLSAAV